ncbi:MFS transporter [Streptomyces solincola]|uniref:MFS transporter n=1 Tax=Streptomyces solincola TaxID=2100817 RepID=UPI0015E34134|nr:MFS transporter [Streptomyces solincola]
MRRTDVDSRRRWWILGTMTAARAMVAIDALAVLVALPVLQREFDVPYTDLPWIVNSFLLSYAGLVALGGRAGDALGRVWVFRAGVLVFVAGSVAGGLAQSLGWLLAARVAQGAGAAFLRPTAEAITVAQFGRHERGRAMGIASSVSTFFYGSAPLVGGALTTTFSWRAIFFLTLPVGMACVAAVHMLLPRAERAHAPVDWRSAPLLVGGLGCVLIAVMKARDWAWASPTVLGLLAAGVLLLGTLVRRELRLAEPIIQLRLFALRGFGSGTGVLAAVRFSYIGFSVFSVVWLQDVLGLTAVEAGLLLLPLTLPSVLVGPVGGMLYDRLGAPLPVAVGGALVAGGMTATAVALPHQSYPWLLPLWTAMGVGIGLVSIPAFSEAYNSTPPDLRSQASGVLETTREVCAALGLAVMGMLVAHVQGARILELIRQDGRIPPDRLPEVERSIGRAVASPEGSGLPAGIPADLLPALKEAVTDAVSTGFYTLGAITLLAMLPAVLLLPRRPPGRSAEPGEDGAGRPA